MFKSALTVLSLTSVVAMSSCATAADPLPGCPDEVTSGDFCAFDSRRDAWLDVETAQNTAMEDGRKTLIVMGANWCHDSRALAGHFQKPRFQSLIAEHYNLVYVEVGRKNRNLDIANSFGLDGIVGTPTVIITDSASEVLNLDTAPTWRNAADRSEDDIFTYFSDYSKGE